MEDETASVDTKSVRAPPASMSNLP